MKVLKEIDHEPRTVREVRVFVRQTAWADGNSSYGVYLVHPVMRWKGDERIAFDDLTEERDQGEFDHMPSDAEIEQLPYIRPSIAKLSVGVYVILTGPYQSNFYPNRTAARRAIRRGEW